MMGPWSWEGSWLLLFLLGHPRRDAQQLHGLVRVAERMLCRAGSSAPCAELSFRVHVAEQALLRLVSIVLVAARSSAPSKLSRPSGLIDRVLASDRLLNTGPSN